MYERGAVHRQHIRPANGGLSAIGLMPLKNRLAFTVNDAFWVAMPDCGGGNCSGHARRLSFDLAQDRQSTTRRNANKLNPKRLQASRLGCVSVHLRAQRPNEVEACAHLARDQERKPHS
jgi:hypothetical protein